MISNEKTLYIKPLKIGIALGSIAGILLLLNLGDQFNRYLLNLPVVLLPEFHLDKSNDISAYFLATLHLLSSIILGMIGAITLKRRDPFSIYWIALAVSFLFVSADKVVDLHERFFILFWKYSNMTIRQNLTWIIPAIIFVAGFLILKLLLHLPSKERGLLIFSALLFISGAVGMDYLGDIFSESAFAYGILTDIEVGLEMFGSIVFIYSLLCYLSCNDIYIIVKTTN